MNGGCLATLIHPFRSTRMFLRICSGKPPFKPGSRLDRKWQKVLEREQEREDREDVESLAREEERLLRGYDTLGGQQNGPWEMEVEDWEETGA